METMISLYNAFNFGLINLILIVGAALGTWLGFIQGRWLGNTKIVQNWMAHLPEKYHRKSELLFHKYGLHALFIGRFIAFVRTLMPMMAGLSGLQSKRFHVYNWLSATLWIFLIVTLGYFFGMTSLFKNHQREFMSLLTLIPVALLVLGLVLSLIMAIKRWITTKK